MKRTLVGLLAVFMLVLAAAFVLPLEVKTKHAVICDVTGSRYGYTRWFFGGRTSKWYQKSGLEKFLEEKHPTELQHRWNAYANTGQDIFGRNIVFRCGPRPPLLFLPPEFIADYCSKASDHEKFETYKSLLRANRQEAEHIADSISAQLAADIPAQPKPNTVYTNRLE